MSCSWNNTRRSSGADLWLEHLEERTVLSGDVVSLRALDAVCTEGGTWAGMDGGYFTRDGIVWTVDGFRADNAVVVLERSGSVQLDPLEVQFTVGGTATGGADYPAIAAFGTTTGVANFAAGSRTTRIVINPFDDLLQEQPETITLTLNAGPDYSVHPSRRSATITVIDDEPTVTIIAKDPRASERTRGQDGGSFLVSRSGRDLLHALDVDLLIAGSASEGDDYAPLPSRVTIPAGQKSVLVPVIIADDARAEVLETITATLQPTDAYHLGRINERTATVTILDNEPLVTVTSGKSASEGAALPSDGSFKFTRMTTDASAPLVAHYTVSASSTATAGIDYERLDGTVTFAAGQKSATVLVHPIADGVNEPTEPIIITLDADEGYLLPYISYCTATVKLNNFRRVDFISSSGFGLPHRWDYSIGASLKANGQTTSLTALMHAQLDRAGPIATWSFDVTDASDPDIQIDLPSFAFRESEDGIYLDTLTNEDQFDLGLDSMRLSPRLLAGTLTDSSPIDLAAAGVHFVGTATLKTTLGKQVIVTVPAGTYEADPVSITLRLSGKATSGGAVATFALTLSMTMLTVPDVGPVRIIEQISATASAQGTRVSVAASVTAELLSFD